MTIPLSVKNNIVFIFSIFYVIYLLHHQSLIELLIFISIVTVLELKKVKLDQAIIFSFMVTVFLIHYHDYVPQRVIDQEEQKNLLEGFRFNSPRKKYARYDQIEGTWDETDDYQGGDEYKQDLFDEIEQFSNKKNLHKRPKSRFRKFMTSEERKKLKERHQKIKAYRKQKKILKEQDEIMYSGKDPKYNKNKHDIFDTKTRSLNESFEKLNKLKENFYLIVNAE